jgi:hypothetical protein
VHCSLAKVKRLGETFVGSVTQESQGFLGCYPPKLMQPLVQYLAGVRQIAAVGRVQDERRSWHRCSDEGVGNALIHHSIIAECEHTHAPYVDTRLACHSQAASQGTGAVNVCNADMAMC